MGGRGAMEFLLLESRSACLGEHSLPERFEMKPSFADEPFIALGVYICTERYRK